MIYVLGSIAAVGIALGSRTALPALILSSALLVLAWITGGLLQYWPEHSYSGLATVGFLALLQGSYLIGAYIAWTSSHAPVRAVPRNADAYRDA